MHREFAWTSSKASRCPILLEVRQNPLARVLVVAIAVAVAAVAAAVAVVLVVAVEPECETSSSVSKHLTVENLLDLRFVVSTFQ
jgi:hypothetical protein